MSDVVRVRGLRGGNRLFVGFAPKVADSDGQVDRRTREARARETRRRRNQPADYRSNRTRYSEAEARQKPIQVRTLMYLITINYQHMDSILIRRQLQIIDLICTEYKVPRAKKQKLIEMVHARFALSKNPD